MDKKWSSSFAGRVQLLHLSYHYLTISGEECSDQQPSSYLCLDFFLLYKIVYGLPTFTDAWFSLCIYRRFQIFRIIKFALWIFVFLVLIVSSVKVNLLGSFFAKMRAFTRFLFIVLVAKFEFAGFRKQKRTELMTVSMEMVRMAKSRPRKNQSECTDLPQDYLAI